MVLTYPGCSPLRLPRQGKAVVLGGTANNVLVLFAKIHRLSGFLCVEPSTHGKFVF